MLDFNNLNEYQQRDELAASVLAEQLTEIASHMDGWHLIPRDRSKEEHIPMFRYLSNEDGSRQIFCESNRYNCVGKFRFSAMVWPSYTENEGEHLRTCTVTPSQLWRSTAGTTTISRGLLPARPTQSSPETMATHGREFAAIAKQIERKIIPEYERLYILCQEQAASYQVHSNEVQDCKRRLAKSTRQDIAHYGGRGSTFYIRELPGDPVGIEYRSPGDCRVNLSTDEMIEVVALLRELRAE
jgi:hypothetical protein